MKSNPLRLEYESSVRELQKEKERLLNEGCPVEEIARLLHAKRRQLGVIYKDAAPPLFRAYILYATKQKYGDPLGPSYEMLRKNKSPEQIMESAARPIQDLNDRLTLEGFAAWFQETYNYE